MRRLAWASLVLCAVVAPAHPPEFWTIGLLQTPGESRALAISHHGRYVTGVATSDDGVEAFRFDYTTFSLTALGDLDGGAFSSTGLSVNNVGRVVGWGTTAQGPEAALWRTNVALPLGTLPGHSGSVAVGVERTTELAVGSSLGPDGPRAVVFDGGTVTSLAGDPSGKPGSGALGVSERGAVIVGWSEGALGPEATAWVNRKPLSLGSVFGGDFTSVATAISQAGNIITGQASTAFGRQAFICPLGGKMRAIGDLKGGPVESYATAINGGGSMIVGWGTTPNGREAFVWDRALGMRRLIDACRFEWGLGQRVTNWTFVEATGISGNGKSIVGWGIHPLGFVCGFLIHTGDD